MASAATTNQHTPAPAHAANAVPSPPGGPQHSQYVMVYSDAQRRWVASQRKPPRGLKALAAAGEARLLDEARMAELENRPRWGGKALPTKPLKPLDPEAVRAARRFHGHHTHDHSQVVGAVGASGSVTARQAAKPPALASTDGVPATARAGGAVSLPPITAAPTSPAGGRPGSDSVSSPAAYIGSPRTDASSPRARGPVHVPTAVELEAEERRKEARRRRRSRQRSSLPGHHPLQLSQATPAEETAEMAKELDAFERKVPAIPMDDDDEDDGPSRSMGGGRLMRAASTLVGAARHLGATTAVHHATGGGSSDGSPRGPNPFPGLLIDVPLPRIFHAYAATETERMRRYGMSAADFHELFGRLVPHFAPSRALVDRGFAHYDAAVRSPEPHVMFWTFLAQFGRETSPPQREQSLLFFFDVVAGDGSPASGAILAAGAGQPTASQPPQQNAGRSGSLGAPPPQQQQQQPPEPRKSASLWSPQAVAFARTTLGRPAELTGGAGSDSILLSATMSSGLLLGPNLHAFTRRHVRTGTARAAWHALANALDAEREHVMGQLQRFVSDTAAFQPPPRRTDIERKMLGEAPAVPYPRVTLAQWRYIAYSNARILAALDGALWYPGACSAA